MVVQCVNRPVGRIIAMGAVAAMMCATFTAAPPALAQSDSISTDTSASTVKDVQVIAFQQTWNTIAKECTNTYGPEGVAYVEDKLSTGELCAGFEAWLTN